jgi:NAD(P)-dependent dehydrogenase (short-subunit alcohol dehydrogenase family)
MAAVGRTIPLGRMAVPEDIGNLCVLLASPLCSYVSGASFTADGGGEKPAFLNASTADAVKDAH